MKHQRRVLKFWLLQVFVMPLALLVLKLLARTYRVEMERREEFRELLAGRQRLVVAAWHGTLLSLVALVPEARACGRRFSILTSPSRDGLLVDRLVTALGMRPVKGSSRSKPVSAMRQLVQDVSEGAVALMFLDGPRGPRMVAKSGAVLIAAKSGAKVMCLCTGASRAIRFRSWDRMFLPLPFARITVGIREFVLPPPNTENEHVTIKRVEAMLVGLAHEVNSPIAEGGE